MTRTRVCQAHPEISQTEAVLSRFRQVLHDHDPHALALWLEAAEQSGVQEIRAFVTKLRQDLPAVQAAVTMSWSHDYVAYCTSSLGSRSKAFRKSKETGAAIIVADSQDAPSMIPAPDRLY
jgi:hypothetical protein